MLVHSAENIKIYQNQQNRTIHIKNLFIGVIIHNNGLLMIEIEDLASLINFRFISYILYCRCHLLSIITVTGLGPHFSLIILKLRNLHNIVYITGKVFLSNFLFLFH